MTSTIRILPPRVLKRIIILGIGHQALAVAEFCHRFSIDLEVITGERQRNACLPDGQLIIKELETRGVHVRITNKLSEMRDGPYDTANEHSVILSYSSPFIIHQDLLHLYSGRVLNSHGAPLPEWRGGGGFSWRIMANDRRGTDLYHLVVPGIDEGDVIYRRDYHFPEDARFPRDWLEYAAIQEDIGLKHVLDGLWQGREFSRHPQDESLSTYFPRLHSPSQAYIDWTWPGDCLERFIRAFSHPYSGAMTQCGDDVVHIFDATFAPEMDLRHPFFSGLVYRIHEDRLRVAVVGGSLDIGLSDIHSAKPLRLGDRLFTPQGLLESALAMRPIFTPTGLK